MFADFDREPLAAASVAQVHSARLPSGAEVAVKVQRPGIRTVVERDLDIVARLARSLESRTSWARSLGARELAVGFADAVREELDFRIEAANMAGVAATADGAVRIPVPLQPLCGERVLVMERLAGTPLGAAGPALEERGLDRQALARQLLASMLAQVMVTGVFHADPHPGNVLLLADGRLGLLDFGSVGRLDGSVRAALQRLLLAMDRGDPLGASDALLEVMLRPDEVDTERLERDLGQFMARYLSAGASTGVRMFSDLFRIVTGHGLSIPPEVAAHLPGPGHPRGHAGPARPRVRPGRRGARLRRRPGRRPALDPATARQLVTDELTTLLPMLRRLPRRLERIAGAAEHGRLSVQVRLFADQRDRRHLTGLLHQVLLTILAATAGIMAVLLLGTDRRPLGHGHGQPLPVARLQPAGRLRHSRPPGPGPDLPPGATMTGIGEPPGASDGGAGELARNPGVIATTLLSGLLAVAVAAAEWVGSGEALTSPVGILWAVVAALGVAAMLLGFGLELRRRRLAERAVAPAPGSPAVAPGPAVPALPTGTVTFLFTDIEGSTRLLRAAGPTATAAAVTPPRRPPAPGHRRRRTAAQCSSTDGRRLLRRLRRPATRSGPPWPPSGPWPPSPGARRGPAPGAHGAAHRGGRGAGRRQLLRHRRQPRGPPAGRPAYGGQVLALRRHRRPGRADALPEGAGLRDLGEHRLKDLQPP